MKREIEGKRERGRKREREEKAIDLDNTICNYFWQI